MFDYLLLTVVFLGIANWLSFYYLFLQLVKPRQKLIPIDNKELIGRIKKKTGLKIGIKIMEINKMIGFMVSSHPFPPIMVFSKKLFNSFNKDEKEWVVLHESAHYLMWHMLKFAFSQIAILLLGFIIINQLSRDINLFLIILIGLLLGIFYIQIAKIFEYQADLYAATHMDNPKGMITGNIKMRKENNGILQNEILKKLFIIAVPYEARIKIAERQMKIINK